ncbi:MAG: nitronate monooxygenase family protein [Pseudomonadota bacterium]|nr:nitronate monooxygenase family protein [Pseudomonadota bacterium]
MKTPICEKLDIEFPLVAFSHCRDVVVEVSKAGGFGMLGAAGHTPESLEIELTWIDEHIDGKPYGVDLIVPTSIDAKEGGLTVEEIEARIPEPHKRYVEQILAEHGIATAGLWDRQIAANFGDNMRESGASQVLEVALDHPVKMVVNALGVPPGFMIDAAREKGILLGALAGTKEHAIKHAEAGLDAVIAAGGEAGGHCGEIATLVLVPEIVETLREYPEVSILAAGGIVTGKQMAACMAMGAEGAWTGSVWLTTAEAETHPVIKEKMLQANSRQTVRSRSRTGKYTRQLRSPWTDAWHAAEAPDPLPMPLQGLVSGPALQKIDKLALSGDPGAKALSTYWVGQGVGLMNETIGARSVVREFMEDFAGAAERLGELME